MADFELTKLIEKKRNGKVLSDEDIHYFVNSVVKTTKRDANFPEGERPDRSQIGAMLMAMYLKGLDTNETAALTVKMKDSGYVFSWDKEWRHLVVDKHSTGGVGDKISLILAPALAALGLKVPMISGRSLSHTGGTLDKLESIPGFRVLLTKEEIHNIVESTGCCIVGQTDDCVPADKVLYQCREITATVTCPPLIIASIVSKKLSEGTSTLVYDVKFGKGSIFSSKEEALNTAKILVETSKGVKAVALLTSMENPLGKKIGNSLEVLEAIQCLQGSGPSDVIQLTIALGSEVLQQTLNVSKDEGEKLMKSVLKDGKALQKFHEMLIQQGVDEDAAREVCYGNADSVLPKARYETDIHYGGIEGYIQEIDPLVLAHVWKEDLFRSNQHPGVGLTLLKVVGDRIQTEMAMCKLCELTEVKRTKQMRKIENDILNGEAWIKIHHECEEFGDEICKLKNAVLVDFAQKERILIQERICSADK